MYYKKYVLLCICNKESWIIKICVFVVDSCKDFSDDDKFYYCVCDRGLVSWKLFL